MKTLALAFAAAMLITSGAVARDCGPDHYRNISGRCVHRPEHARRPPRGATAICRDGTYSFSRHARGTCSHHGGVESWL